MAEAIKLSVPPIGPGENPENIDIISSELDLPVPEWVLLSRDPVSWHGKLTDETLELRGPLPYNFLGELVVSGYAVFFDFAHSKSNNKILGFFGMLEECPEISSTSGTSPLLYYMDPDGIREEDRKYFDFPGEEGLRIMDRVTPSGCYREITYSPSSSFFDYKEFSELSSKISCLGDSGFTTVPKGMRISTDHEDQENHYSIYYSKWWVAKEADEADLERILSI